MKNSNKLYDTNDLDIDCGVKSHVVIAFGIFRENTLEGLLEQRRVE
jgi:hypothetical protein